MSGAIMPEPLIMPTSCTLWPSTMALAVAPLAKVSVVPIVCVTSSQLHGAASKTAVNPACALSMGSGTPITPVDETKISEASQFKWPETCAMIESTASLPRWPVKALLFPAFTTNARARPCAKFARQRSTSAEQHMFCVVTPATVVPSSSAI